MGRWGVAGVGTRLTGALWVGVGEWVRSRSGTWQVAVGCRGRPWPAPEWAGGNRRFLGEVVRPLYLALRRVPLAILCSPLCETDFEEEEKMANMISRESAEALISEQVAAGVFQDVPKTSVFMQLARKLPNMTGKQTRIPVLDMLPLAYWVSGDTGMKQTSRQAWDNVYLNAAELAVIVPLPEAVLDDADFDIIGEVLPRVYEAIGKRVDEAVIFGLNRPPEWQADIITRARQAGNNVSGATVDYDALLGTGGIISKVEEEGFMVSGGIASMGMRAKLRGIVDDSGRPLFTTSMQGVAQYALDGAPLHFPLNGGFDGSVAQLIVGDWSQAVYAIRQDLTVKILDQGIIQDPADQSIVYNLAQQDMIAIRVVFRMGWALPNPATRLNEGRTGCPFAYLEPTTAATTKELVFTVTGGSPAAAIEGAVVEVEGARLKTNSEGKATFNLRDGTYKYRVIAEDYKIATGSKTMAGVAATEAVLLVSKS